MTTGLTVRSNQNQVQVYFTNIFFYFFQSQYLHNWSSPWPASTSSCWSGGTLYNLTNIYLWLYLNFFEIGYSVILPTGMNPEYKYIVYLSYYYITVKPVCLSVSAQIWGLTFLYRPAVTELRMFFVQTSRSWS